MPDVPRVARIHVHPIKALAPVQVHEATISMSGALDLDRRWAFVDGQGRFVNGKNRPDIHTVRSTFDLARLEVSFDGRAYSLERQRVDIARWMSEHLNEPVDLCEDRATGFPDDLSSPGPTFVATSSLSEVAGWFDLALDNARRRFRANVELDGVEAFWEDRLYGTWFLAGDVLVHAINPCQRCAVPSRDPWTGEAIAGFQQRFSEHREETLPAAASLTAFTHYYRLAVNTRIPSSERGKRIHEGDDVRMRALSWRQ
jgi:uncharacterized protein YcbX